MPARHLVALALALGMTAAAPAGQPKIDLSERALVAAATTASSATDRCDVATTTPSISRA